MFCTLLLLSKLAASQKPLPPPQKHHGNDKHHHGSNDQQNGDNEQPNRSSLPEELFAATNIYKNDDYCRTHQPNTPPQEPILLRMGRQDALTQANCVQLFKYKLTRADIGQNFRLELQITRRPDKFAFKPLLASRFGQGKLLFYNNHSNIDHTWEFFYQHGS